MDEILLRDNLLVTAGARAAYMHCAGSISIPSGLKGEDDLAKTVTHIVDKYVVKCTEVNFDEYIESNLRFVYGVKGE